MMFHNNRTESIANAKIMQLDQLREVIPERQKSRLLKN